MKIILLILFLIFNTNAWSQYNNYAPVGYTQCSDKDFEKLKHDRLINELSRKNLKSSDEIFEWLPECYRQHFTLLHNSQSLQSSTYQKPRLVFYGPDAKLLIGLSGLNKKDKKIEIIQFNDSNNQFDFREIILSSKTGIKLSKKNPAKCLNCHGYLNPRPIWESYPSWPAAYGSDDDFRGMGLHSPQAKQSKAEYKKLLDFIKKETADPSYPYQYIPNLENAYKIASGTELQFRRNTELNHKLIVLNSKRIAQLVSNNKALKMMSLPIIGGFILGSHLGVNYSDIFGATLENLVPRNTLDPLYKGVGKKTIRSYSKHVEKYLKAVLAPLPTNLHEMTLNFDPKLDSLVGPSHPRSIPAAHISEKTGHFLKQFELIENYYHTETISLDTYSLVDEHGLLDQMRSTYNELNTEDIELIRIEKLRYQEKVLQAQLGTCQSCHVRQELVDNAPAIPINFKVSKTGKVQLEQDFLDWLAEKNNKELLEKSILSNEMPPTNHVRPMTSSEKLFFLKKLRIETNNFIPGDVGDHSMSEFFDAAKEYVDKSSSP